MCDYSLHHVATRPAKIEDKLVVTKFSNSITRGFAAVGEPHVAVCLLPGTEIAFEENVECEPSFAIGILPNKKIGQRLARFRQINMDNVVTHHDALEFPDGQVILLTRLCEGQRATVLQLPAAPRTAEVKSRSASLSFSSRGLAQSTSFGACRLAGFASLRRRLPDRHGRGIDYSIALVERLSAFFIMFIGFEGVRPRLTPGTWATFTCSFLSAIVLAHFLLDR